MLKIYCMAWKPLPQQANMKAKSKYEISYIGLKNVKDILHGLKTSSTTGKHEGKRVFLRDPTLFQLLQLGQNLFLPSHFPEFLFCFSLLIVVFGRNKFWEAECMRGEEPWKEDGNLERSMKALKGVWKPWKEHGSRLDVVSGDHEPARGHVRVLRNRNWLVIKNNFSPVQFLQGSRWSRWWRWSGWSRWSRWSRWSGWSK